MLGLNFVREAATLRLILIFCDKNWFCFPGLSGLFCLRENSRVTSLRLIWGDRDRLFVARGIVFS